MNTAAIITAILVIGTGWGGLTVFLFKASSYEKKKKLNGKEED